MPFEGRIKEEERVFPYSVDVVWNAVLLAVNNIKNLKNIKIDSANKRVTANTSMSWDSYGQNIEIKVNAVDGVTSTELSKVRVTSEHRFIQMYDFLGIHRKNIEQIFLELTKFLPKRDMQKIESLEKVITFKEVVKVRCEKCGTLVSMEFKHCPDCGQKL